MVLNKNILCIFLLFFPVICTGKNKERALAIDDKCCIINNDSIRIDNDSVFIIGNLKYKQTDGILEVVGTERDDCREYHIASKIKYKGKKYIVKRIGEYAFKNCRNLKRIKIPNQIEVIGSNAFSCCESLENITLSKNTPVRDKKSQIKVGNLAIYLYLYS